MAKNVYVGVDGTSRLVKEIYIGIDGKAKKIRKGYIGVNGIARLFIFPDIVGIKYYGRIEPISVARVSIEKASIGNYAIFAGGYTGSNPRVGNSAVDAYDNLLTHIIASPLSSPVYGVSGASIGNYALFAGGYTPYGLSSSVDSYDNSLTRMTQAPLSKAKYYMISGSIGNYAVFAGGQDTNLTTQNAVETYNESLTKNTATALSTLRSGLGSAASASVGNYLLIPGGSSSIDVYDINLTRTSSSLSMMKSSVIGASISNYALFASGVDPNNPGMTEYRSVDAYNSSLTRFIAPELDKGRVGCRSASIDNYALFVGGTVSTAEDIVNVYNNELTRTQLYSSVGRTLPSGASIGNYALFAGGYNASNQQLNLVEVYTVN